MRSSWKRLTAAAAPPALAATLLAPSAARADSTPECNNGPVAGSTECGEGSHANGTGTGNTAVGAGSLANGDGNTAIGAHSIALSEESYASGYAATAYANGSYASGYGHSAGLPYVQIPNRKSAGSGK